MTKQLIWRLGKLPTPDEVLKLVNDKLITKEEAREILFNEETTEQRSVKDLETEIKFLKELVEKLSDRKTIVEVTKQVLPIYINQPWYPPYYYWSSGSYGSNTVLCGGSSSSGSITNAGNLYSSAGELSSFSSIQTY